MSTELIVALDFATKKQVSKLLNHLDPEQCFLKIGHEMYTHFGPAFVSQLVKFGYKVFLDLKFHDIPNTVARACVAAADLGVWMINVHASGGLAMMTAAKKALEPFGKNKPLLIAVTLLTSLSDSDLPSIGLSGSLDEQITKLSKLAQKAELNGVVCSAQEVPLIKSICGQDFITVTPGIRLSTDNWDDQSRVISPEKAKELGSDYIVVGRSITESEDPAKVVQALVKLPRNQV